MCQDSTGIDVESDRELPLKSFTDKTVSSEVCIARPKEYLPAVSFVSLTLKSNGILALIRYSRDCALVDVATLINSSAANRPVLANTFVTFFFIFLPPTLISAKNASAVDTSAPGDLFLRE